MQNTVSTSAVKTTQMDKIRQLFEERYQGAVRASDPAAYAALFTADAVWINPDAPTQHGPEAIGNALAGALTQMSFHPTITVEEVEIDQQLAFARGKVDLKVMPKEGEDMKRIFRILWIVKKQDQEWKIYRQIYNDDVQLPSA